MLSLRGDRRLTLVMALKTHFFNLGAIGIGPITFMTQRQS